MGYSDLFRTVLILTCISHIHSQYYDIFQAFQPFVQPEPSQPLNFLNDFTTRRPKPKQKAVSNVRHEENTRRLDRIPIADSINNDNVRKTAETNKRTTKRKQTNPFDFNFYTSTQRTTRKTTKAPQRKNQNRPETQLSSIVFFDDAKKFDRPITSIREIDNKPKSRPSNRKPQIQETNYDSNWYDGRNTVNYYTTRPPQTTKVYNYQQSNKKNNNYYSTHNPLLNRPGVKPAVVNGPPITNRPVTQRPGFDHKQGINIDDDLSVSPEVISGPDEDYMTAVEKKRYVDIAERMCDKYKSLTTKQVEAIPLLPSPQPVRVNVSSCPPTTIPLVVGGKIVSVKEFPHMTLLGWRKKNRGYSWKCGGTLLSNQHILTAAHCAYQDRDDTVIIGPPRIVQLGSSYLNDPQAVYMRVASVTKHPKYKIPKAYYDLAIVKMAGTVKFSDTIKPACLGTPPPPNSPIIATGWGKTEFGGSLSEELRSVSLPVWDLSECYNALGVSVKIPYGPSSDSQICAGEKRGGKDTCQGDSGGPAQIQDGCVWRVVAVTSVGRYCGAADTPAIYAIVQRAFISAVVFKDALNDNNNRGQATNTNDWNKKQQSNTNQQNNQATNNNDWNNRKQQSSTTNQQNNNYNRPSGNNNWNVKPSDTGTDNYGNNRETYSWNNSNQGGGAYPTNSQPNRNEYNNNNNYNYNLQTTENYSNSRRDEYYNPSPPRETEVVEGQFYNNYAGSNNFNNNYNKQQDYVSDGRGDNYNNNNNNGGNVWWT